MSGLEVIGAISAVIDIVDGVAKVWTTAQKDIKFTKEFETAASKVFILQSILKTCEDNFKKIGSLPKDDDNRLAAVMRSCEANVKKLQTVFEETVSGGKDKWHEKYKKAWKRFGTGSRVEELILNVVEDTKIVATYNEVISLSPDLGQKLDEVAKELQSLKPSVTEDLTNAYTFTNTGEGRQIINTGDGPQLNDNARILNQGDGNPIFNFGIEHSEHWFTDHLQFDGQYVRESHLSLRRVDPNSFDWLWESPFKQWVASADQKVFWITGKPASGKSMCMKYISTHKLDFTRPCLCIRFFFNYAADSSSNKSNTIEGLRRSILVQICKAVKELSPSIVKRFDLKGALRDEWILNSEILSEIMDFAFDELDRLEKPVFILLDGLDDYKGDLCDVVEVVQEIEAKPAVLKLCVASRPHEFGTQFGGWPKLYLEQYNQRAIFVHALNKLIRHCSPAEREQQEENLSRLSRKLAIQSGGVFLWADFATRELCNLLRRKADIEQHEELLRRLPDALTEYYDRIILGLGDDRIAWGIVFMLIASAKEPLWISQLYEACHHLGLQILKHDGIVTEKKLHNFIDCLHHQTGGLLNLSLLKWQDRQGRTNLRAHPAETVEVGLIHRSLRNFLDSNDGWARHFGLGSSNSKATDIWLTIAEATLSKPLSHAGELDRRMILRRGPTSEPLLWPRPSLHILVRPLKRYVASHLPQHMFDHETETRTPVPWRLVQFLEQQEYFQQHFLEQGAVCAYCRVIPRSQMTVETIPQLLLAHQCELSVAQCIQKKLDELESEAWKPLGQMQFASSLVSARYATSFQGQSLLAIATRRLEYGYSIHRPRAMSILRLITSNVTVVRDSFLVQAIERLDADVLKIVLENCTKPGRLVLKLGKNEKSLAYQHERPLSSSGPYGPLWFVGNRYLNEDLRKILELFLARGEDIKEDCGPEGTIIHSAILRWLPSECFTRGSEPTDEYLPLIQALAFLACYGARIEPSGPNIELRRFSEKCRDGRLPCHNCSQRGRVCNIGLIDQYLENPVTFTRDNPEIRKKIQQSREEMGYELRLAFATSSAIASLV